MQLFDIKKQTAGLQLTYTVKPEDTVDTVGLGMCTHQQMPFRPCTAVCLRRPTTKST